ncbi:MAG: response regulator transcription factor [Holdemania massiliensis]
MKTILIVEDDPAISNLIAELLISQGYQITQAYSGTEAQWVLQHRQPDLILLDLMLPGIQGEAV